MIYSPLIPTGFTDFGYLFAPKFKQSPHSTLCAELEMRLMDCLEAYGARSVREKCVELLYDVHECQHKTFQNLRGEAIRKERMRQYRAGKLDTPFSEYPAMDAYLYI